MKFKEKSHLRDIKVPGEATSAYVEAVANYLEDQAKRMNKCGYKKHRFSIR